MGSYAPKVLVVSVGLNPVPVALSVLTLKPTHVVLVHSEETAAEACRIREVVSRVAGAAAPACWLPWEVPDTATKHFVQLGALLGTPEPGAAPVSQAGPGTLWGLLEEQAGRESGFILDYTGGTQVMASCLVEFHIAWHGRDLPRQRSYVPAGLEDLHFGGQHRPTGGSTARFLPLYRGLSLLDRALLNGYAPLEGWHWAGEAVQRVPGAATVINWPALDVHTEEHAKTKWASNLGDFLDGAVSLGASSVRPEPPKQGTQAECLLAALLAETRPDELLLGVKLALESQARPVAEFDVVWRRGSAVLVAEVKTSFSNDTLNALASRVLLSRDAFGDAVENLAWIAHASRRHVSAVENAVGVLGESEFFGHGRVVVLPSGADRRGQLDEGGIEGVREQLLPRWLPDPRGGNPDWDPWPQVAGPACGAADAPWGSQIHAQLDRGEPPASALGAIGGSPLAARSAQLIEGVTVDLIKTPHVKGEVIRFLGVPTTAPYMGRKAPQDELEALGELERLARERRPAGFIVTAGTKAVTAAMTALAVRDGLDLAHIDSERDVAVTRAGAQLRLRDESVDWPAFLQLSGCGLGGPADQQLREQLAKADSTSWTAPWLTFTPPPVGNLKMRDVYPEAIQLGPHRVRVAHDLKPLDVSFESRVKSRLAATMRVFGEAADVVFVVHADPKKVRCIAGHSPFKTMSRAQQRRTALISVVDGAAQVVVPPWP